MTYGKRFMVALWMLTGAMEVAGQTGKVAGSSPILPRRVDTSEMSSSPSPGRRSSYHMAAARSSACASGCSSTRTTLFELSEDLRPRGGPVDRPHLTLGDLAR